MDISLCLNPSQLRRWHRWLVDLLVRDGHNVGLRFESSAYRFPPALSALMELQRVVSGAGERALDRIASDDLLAASRKDGGGDGPAADLEIRLTDGEPHAGRSGLSVLRPLYDGSHDEAALWVSLLQRRAPVLALAHSDGHRIEIARPALENPNSLVRSGDNVLSRLAEGIALACGPVPRHRPHPSPAISGHDHEMRDIPVQAVGALAWRHAQAIAGNTLAHFLGTAPTWWTGWRHAPGGRTHLGPLPGIEEYSQVATDGQRFYADPFVLFHAGAHHVFVEELPYATQKGRISHFTIDAQGHASEVKPVLECAHHLSYPQVFVREGEIYLLPEASSSGRLDLYRAERFPDRWVHAARLIDEPLHDATLFQHDGRFYITAGTQTLRSASYDALGIYSAPSLFGPWAAHAGNPILVDARVSRPAGAIYELEGSLWRPAQNGTRGYGSSIELARITALGPTSFEQEIAASHRFSDDGRILGPHTLNWCTGIEVVDYFASSASLPMRR